MSKFNKLVVSSTIHKAVHFGWKSAPFARIWMLLPSVGGTNFLHRREIQPVNLFIPTLQKVICGVIGWLISLLVLLVLFLKS